MESTTWRINENRNGERSGCPDCYGLDAVALFDGIDDILAGFYLAEHGVFTVEPLGFDVGDEELAAVGVRT